MLARDHKIVGIFGWYGMVAIVLAYALNNFGFFRVSDPWYLFFNITGSLGIISDSWYHKAWQSVSLNIVWVLVGVVGVFKYLF